MDFRVGRQGGQITLACFEEGHSAFKVGMLVGSTPAGAPEWLWLSATVTTLVGGALVAKALLHVTRHLLSSSTGGAGLDVQTEHSYWGRQLQHGASS